MASRISSVGMGVGGVRVYSAAAGVALVLALGSQVETKGSMTTSEAWDGALVIGEANPEGGVFPHHRGMPGPPMLLLVRPDVRSPRPAGTVVTWLAYAAGGTPPLQYRFWLFDPHSGAWTILRDYGASNQATWRPGAPGSYVVQVWVRSAGSTKSHQAWRSSREFVVTAPASVTSITSSIACPVFLGTPVTWTATAAGGVSPLSFRFWLQDQTAGTWTELAGYGPAPSARWVPASRGTYAVQVWVRSEGSTSAYEGWRTSGACTVVAAPLKVVELTASPASPVGVGTPVIWEAAATGGTPPLQFKFWLHDVANDSWVALQDYGPSAVASWVPATTGTYRVQVWARSAGSTAGFDAWLPSGDYIVTPAYTARVSVVSDTTEATGPSHGRTVISPDGRTVAFASQAANLVEGDANGTWDVFVHDRATRITSRVSVSTAGREADDSSYGPALSADARFVAFDSWATNLVAGDVNGFRDVLIHDRRTGTTSLISAAPGGKAADGESYGAGLSADGRFVTFSSQADNLVPGDANVAWDVFVHDRLEATTTLVSLASDGSQGNFNSAGSFISADGRFVAFSSIASNLVPGDTNAVADVFVRDRLTATTTRVSLTVRGAEASSGVYCTGISADGRYIAFYSYAANLVAGDTNRVADAFVHDRQTATTTRVSVTSGGAEGQDSSYAPTLSGDGRFVAFTSRAPNLVSGDINSAGDVVWRDQQGGTMSLVSIATGRAQGNGDSYIGSISADGRVVAFDSLATNLVAGDTNGEPDVFVRDRGVPGPVIALLVSADLASPRAAGTPVIWTAYATGGTSTLEYKFWIRERSSTTWSLLRNYAADNTVRWTAGVAGTYAVQVWVRSSGSSATYEAWRGSSPFLITP